jgi:hypothetical protein
MFDLKKLKEAECKGKSHVEVTNGYAALEDLDTEAELQQCLGND